MLREDERGTASVEIVVMLPVFVLLFLGVYHLHSVGSAALSAAERARGCAFEFAVSGCQHASSGLCAGVTAAATGQVLNNANAGAQGSDALEVESGVSEDVQSIPVVRDVWNALFGEGSVARASDQTARFMESGRDAVSRQHYMVCNTVSKSWGQLRHEQLCGLADKLGIGKGLLGC